MGKSTQSKQTYIKSGGIAAAGLGLTGLFVTNVGLLQPRRHEAAAGAGSELDVSTFVFELHNNQGVMNVVVITIGVGFNGAIKVQGGLDIFAPPAAIVIGLVDSILDQDSHNGLLFC
jgi:hypothetical protein